MCAWTDQIWLAGNVNQGSVVRRNTQSVMIYSSHKELEREVRTRGFHMAVTGGQYVIVCDPAATIHITC
jgi:hypothetical protein